MENLTRFIIQIKEVMRAIAIMVMQDISIIMVTVITLVTKAIRKTIMVI